MRGPVRGGVTGTGEVWCQVTGEVWCDGDR